MLFASLESVMSLMRGGASDIFDDNADVFDVFWGLDAWCLRRR